MTASERIREARQGSALPQTRRETRKSQGIAVGVTLRLKADNAYGFGPQLVTVAEVRYRGGYKTPWLVDNQGQAFRPSDFQ